MFIEDISCEGWNKLLDGGSCLIGVIPCSSSSVLILLFESASIPEALRDLFVL